MDTSNVVAKSDEQRVLTINVPAQFAAIRNSWRPTIRLYRDFRSSPLMIAWRLCK